MATKRIVIALCAAGALSLPASAGAHTLTYSGARERAEQRGTELTRAVAGVDQKLTYCQRTSPHRFLCQVQWRFIQPAPATGCDPSEGTCFDVPTTRNCYARIVVRFPSRRSRGVVTTTDGQACA